MRPRPFLLLLAGFALAMLVAASPRRRWPPLSPPWPSSRCAGDADRI